MRTITALLLGIMLLSGNLTFCQKSITINYEVDEFTGIKKYTSTWFNFTNGFDNKNYTFLRFMKIDSSYFINFKVATGAVLSVDAEDELYLKLDNDTILIFYNLQYTLSGYGDGAIGFAASDALGINLFFPTNLEAIKILGKHSIYKFRLMTSIGYHEYEIAKKLSKNLQLGANMFYNYFNGK